MSRGARLETELVVYCVLAIALAVAALMHLARQSPEALARAKVNRGAWLALLIFGVAIPLPGIVFPIAYLTAIRGKLTSR